MQFLLAAPWPSTQQLRLLWLWSFWRPLRCRVLWQTIKMICFSLGSKKVHRFLNRTPLAMIGFGFQSNVSLIAFYFAWSPNQCVHLTLAKVSCVVRKLMRGPNTDGTRGWLPSLICSGLLSCTESRRLQCQLRNRFGSFHHHQMFLNCYRLPGPWCWITRMAKGQDLTEYLIRKKKASG